MTGTQAANPRTSAMRTMWHVTQIHKDRGLSIRAHPQRGTGDQVPGDRRLRLPAAQDAAPIEDRAGAA
jgi:hypothetical protein